jgi:hypothetical protein
VIMFILDLYFYRYPSLHLWLFWITTVATVLGMTFCFYSEATVRILKKFLPTERNRKDDDQAKIQAG